MACGSYTWIDGNTYTASNNSATFTILNGSINGCDSTVTLDLTISNSVSGTDHKWLVDHIHGLMEIRTQLVITPPSLYLISINGCDSSNTRFNHQFCFWNGYKWLVDHIHGLMVILIMQVITLRHSPF